MHAVDIYGLSEVMGPGVASECVETKDGLHIWEDHFYPEIIDPVTGEVLPDGEKGELVFTSLTKEALPIIRYRTRDLTRLLPGTARVDAADGEDHRPLRRHDHPARRQRLPDPDRGADPEVRRPRPALPDRADPHGPDGRDDRPCRMRAERTPDDGARAASAKELAHHIKCGRRRVDEDRGARSGRASPAPKARRSAWSTTGRKNDRTVGDNSGGSGLVEAPCPCASADRHANRRDDMARTRASRFRGKATRHS